MRNVETHLLCFTKAGRSQDELMKEWSKMMEKANAVM